MGSRAKAVEAAPAAKQVVTDLASLQGTGVFIDEGIKTETVSWIKQDGSMVEFDVFVKAEMSAADYEFIYLGIGDNKQEPSLMARRVHRLVRMANGQSIPLEDAYRFKRELLGAICEAINRAEVVEPTPKA